ncbi:hypothetical protein PTKIN_Ptkin02bG0007300 [Pterospermum kingtungense]
MGGVFYPLTFLFILFVVLIPSLFADNYSNYSNTNNHRINSDSDNVVDGSNPSPSPSPSPSFQHISSPFKPTIAVIVGVLTTLFSVTFLLLLYAKHCGTRNNSNNNNNPFIYSHGRNSGINRAVVESLPLFRFSSLRGHQKDGLDCAVCLTRFQPNELLRLLPKCKHAFHVECVDTWLDAHSTCPLCRYRVDPEDILLIEDHQNQDLNSTAAESEASRTRRVSGRHSYAAGERARNSSKAMWTWFRRSLDSNSKDGGVVVGVGVYRKDGNLLVREDDDDHEKKRLEHRIIVSGSGDDGGESGVITKRLEQRWSDVQPSDLLYLRSEMIISQNRKLGNGIGIVDIGIDGIGRRSIINSRSVSEITSLARFSSCNKNDNDNNNNNNNSRCRRGETAGLVSRWLAWISSTSHSDIVPSQPVQTQAGLP